ncbi:MAG: RdgB/HAM1 family non-canonical purine NTP pyrophosphatase [Steroidobacteraceae bacterium]
MVLATGNAGKLAEMRAILAAPGLELIPQSDFGIAPPVEDGASFVANALIKARHAAALSGLPAIADDSGLEVDALGGRPGLNSARYAGSGATASGNNELLLRELAGIPDVKRGARYRCAMVFIRAAADPNPIIAETSWEGRIGHQPRGNAGFGFDPLFIVGGDGRTAAELPAQQKNRLSHRGQALAALAVRMRQSGW